MTYPLFAPLFKFWIKTTNSIVHFSVQGLLPTVIFPCCSCVAHIHKLQITKPDFWHTVNAQQEATVNLGSIMNALACCKLYEHQFVMLSFYMFRCLLKVQVPILLYAFLILIMLLFLHSPFLLAGYQLVGKAHCNWSC